MLDLKSLVVCGTVHNRTAAVASDATGGDTGKIKFLSPSLSGTLSSARVVISGVEVSSCDYIARTEEVLSRLGSNDERPADFEAGFGLKAAAASDIHGQYETNPIPLNGNRNVTWRPKTLVILNCTSYLPLSLLSSPFILELTFADDLKSGLNTSFAVRRFLLGFEHDLPLRYAFGRPVIFDRDLTAYFIRAQSKYDISEHSE